MFTYFLSSDLAHSTRMTEDGPEPCIVEVYGVVAEREDGARWALKYGTTDIVAAEAMLAKVIHYSVGRTPEGTAKWHRIEARYGSAAWDEREAMEAEARALDVEDPNEARRMRGACGLLQGREGSHPLTHIGG